MGDDPGNSKRLNMSRGVRKASVIVILETSLLVAIPWFSNSKKL